MVFVKWSCRKCYGSHSPFPVRVCFWKAQTIWNHWNQSLATSVHSLEFSRSPLKTTPRARLVNLPRNLPLSRLAPPTSACHCGCSWVVGMSRLEDSHRNRDTDGFIVTRSIIRAMIITESMNFRLHSSWLKHRCYYLTVTTLFKSSLCSSLLSEYLTHCCIRLSSLLVSQKTKKKKLNNLFSALPICISASFDLESKVDKIIGCDLYPSLVKVSK